MNQVDRSAVSGPRLSFATRALQVGAVALATGALIYLASRSPGGGWAGVLLSGMFSWFAFEVGITILRGLDPVPGVRPRHAVLGGCMTAIAAFLGIVLLAFSGQQLVWGVILGGISTVVTHRTRLPTLAQMARLELMPDTVANLGPSLPLVQLRPVAVILAALCLLAGLTLGGLGTSRTLERYSYATDAGCPHPCGMVRGLWVQVLPNAEGDFVTRLDAAAVQVRLRFSDEVAKDRTASPDGFTVANPPTVYEQAASRQGCDAWRPQVLHFGDSTGDLNLCFAVPQSQEADLSQLVLDWAEADVTAPMLLGKTPRFSVGIDVNTDDPSA